MAGKCPAPNASKKHSCGFSPPGDNGSAVLQIAYDAASQEYSHHQRTKSDSIWKKASTKTVEQDIPELKREQLGKGVWGKYLEHFLKDSNVVVLQPEILKAFPTSEAVNKALP